MLWRVGELEVIIRSADSWVRDELLWRRWEGLNNGSVALDEDWLIWAKCFKLSHLKEIESFEKYEGLNSGDCV